MIDDLSLVAIDGLRNHAASEEIVAAVVFAAQNGYGAHTAHRFVSALVMTDTLRDPSQWTPVLRKIVNLQIEADIATLEAGRPVVGEVPE